MNQSLQNWIANNLLTVTEINDKLIQIEGVGKFLIVEPKNLSIDGNIERDKIFDSEFQILLSDSESELTDNVDFLLFQFGNNWYYTNDLVPNEIIPFRYIGKPKLDFPEYTFPMLGLHGGFELANGSRLYSDWVKKAKFLGIDTLGIAEQNTLAGTLAFQEDCKKKEIKSIIGETITVLAEDKSKFHIKLYAQNEEGWKNLLWVNKIINVDNGGEFVGIGELLTNCLTEGLICVLSPEVDLKKYLQLFQNAFKCLYFQLDFVEWSSSSRDEQWLNSLKYYLENHFQKGLQPILIPDAYYLEKEDYEIKKVLNNIGKVGFKNSSKDQYFKSIDAIYNQALSLFKDDDVRIIELMDSAIENTVKLCKSIDFKIPVGFFRLPEYEMSEEEEGLYGSNEDMFWALIEKGLDEKVFGKVKNEHAYIERIQEEVEVIKAGGFVSYFLMLHDIINYCKNNGIWYGIGRGSAAGSLVSYLLGIVGIDPLQYGLLFSRFLNRGRIGKQLPDIDSDIMASRRDEVKRYVESKYGNDFVTAIGTYSTFKAKGSIKDFAREKGIDYSKTNFITSLLPKVDKPGEELEFTHLFKNYGVTNSDFKKYIQKYPQIFELIPLVLNQPKASSVHASGVVVVPKKYGSIYEQMPVKKVDGLLVSEWEGEIIDKAGFTKLDLLGVKQLDKIAAIAKLIKENHNETVTFDDIQLDDPTVFEYFKDARTIDVFQFGTAGLRAYCKELQPDSINDLIAAVALYRPGTMDNGLHKKYVKIKSAIEKPEYDEGTYEATKDTYGIAIYQEQVMQITVDVAGFDLVMADDVRKGMGKRDKKLLDTYKEKFIQGGRSKGYKEDYLSYLWGKLETFAGYGFNKCISGDERFLKVGFNNSKSHYHPTIAEMYKIKNNYTYAKNTGHLSLHGKYKRCGYGSSFSLNEEKRLVRNSIKDIRYVGIKDIYRVTLESDRTIDVTLNHKFPTTNGEKKLEDIDIKKDLLYVNIGYLQDDTCVRFNVGGNNLPVKGQQGFQNRDTSYTRWQALKEEANKKDYCELCLNKADRYELHHKDNNHTNNEPDNVINLCVSCHKKEQYKLGRTKMGESGLYTYTESIVSIEFLKKDEVYDVEMEAPYHTFTLKNGIVTSNSHAAAYAITGYYCQWFKVHYPLEFWTVSLHYAAEEEIIDRIAEINKTSNIQVASVDINKSIDKFFSEQSTNTIYWAINSVKWVGEKALNDIMNERNQKGLFYSLEEFCERISGTKVNKRCIINLILAGAFDKIERINSNERGKLLERFTKFTGSTLPEDIQEINTKKWKPYQWILKQKELTGFGYIDYSKIVAGSNFFAAKQKRYLDIAYCNTITEHEDYNDVVISGILTDLKVWQSKKKDGYWANIGILDNTETIRFMLWKNEFEKFGKIMEESVGKIVIVNGKMAYDDYRQLNKIDSTSKTIVEII